MKRSVERRGPAILGVDGGIGADNLAKKLLVCKLALSLPCLTDATAYVRRKRVFLRRGEKK